MWRYEPRKRSAPISSNWCAADYVVRTIRTLATASLWWIRCSSRIRQTGELGIARRYGIAKRVLRQWRQELAAAALAFVTVQVTDADASPVQHRPQGGPCYDAASCRREGASGASPSSILSRLRSAASRPPRARQSLSLPLVANMKAWLGIQFSQLPPRGQPRRCNPLRPDPLGRALLLSRRRPHRSRH